MEQQNEKIEIVYDRSQRVEDAQRISDILRRKEVKKINIKVKCKNCNWKGQAVVGKKGYPIDGYKCPECGQDLKRGEGSYEYFSEKAELK